MENLKEPLINVPVLLIFFARPETFDLVFEKVREARPSILLLACDGPRPGNQQDADNVQLCKQIAENIDWQCTVYKKYSDVNLGCGKGPSSAIAWALSIVDRVVILEDDCVPCQSFFSYMEQLLELYKDDERIGMISGLNHFKQWDCGGNSYCYTKTGAIWGWGTWRRVWEKYDFAMQALSNPYYKELLKREIGHKCAARKRMQIWEAAHSKVQKGENISYWDHQFGFEKYIQSLLVIVPKYNLICNCGVGEGSTHTVSVHAAKWRKGKVHFIPTRDLEFPLKHPKAVICDRSYDEEYFNMAYPGFVKKIIRKILRTIKK